MTDFNSATLNPFSCAMESEIAFTVISRSWLKSSFSNSAFFSIKFLYFDNISLIEIVTSIVDETDFIKTDYILYNNYPNPFNPTTNISFNIAESGYTTLKIYDILGNEISTLIKKELVAGKYDVDFDAGNLPSGIYFYQLQTPNFTQTKKMILLK